jgi:hypothetical protein
MNSVSPAGRIIYESAPTVAANKLNDSLAAIDFERTIKPRVRVPRIETCFHLARLYLTTIRLEDVPQRTLD